MQKWKIVNGVKTMDIEYLGKEYRIIKKFNCYVLECIDKFNNYKDERVFKSVEECKTFVNDLLYFDWKIWG